MLINNEDGTFTTGPLDLLAIFSDPKTGRYHAGFLEEKPLPGGVCGAVRIARLKSKMHHTPGSDTIDGAREELKKLSERIKVREEHLWLDPVIEFDASAPATVIVLDIAVSDGIPFLVKPAAR